MSRRLPTSSLQQLEDSVVSQPCSGSLGIYPILPRLEPSWHFMAECHELQP